MDLYQELIIEHAKRPHRAGLREPFDAEVHHVNPTCGDEVTLRVARDGEVLSDISYDSLGCSISVASASMLADLLTGQDVDTARTTFAAVHAMLTSKGADAGDEAVIGDAVAFLASAESSFMTGSALGTEIMGIHALFGAFLAGVVMPQSQTFLESQSPFRTRVPARRSRISTA